MCEPPHRLTLILVRQYGTKGELKNMESYAREPLRGYGCQPLHLVQMFWKPVRYDPQLSQCLIFAQVNPLWGAL